MKICKTCLIQLPLDRFNPRKDSKDGLAYVCKSCRIVYRKKNPEIMKIYRQKNKLKLRQDNNKYIKRRLKTDKIFAFAHQTRTQLTQLLTSDRRALRILGCTVEQFKNHLEGQFQFGMNWDNYGRSGWHIDHIKPLKLAKTKDDVLRLCHYTNLQPLWAKDNYQKGSSINE